MYVKWQVHNVSTNREHTSHALLKFLKQEELLNLTCFDKFIKNNDVSDENLLQALASYEVMGLES